MDVFGTPVPDFDFDEDDVESECARPCLSNHGGLTLDDIAALHGPMAEEDVSVEPIKATENSAVFAVEARGQLPVAVKVTGDRRRLVEEYNNRLALGNSPRLLAVYGLVCSSDKAMLVMELADRDIRGERLEEWEVCCLIHDVAQALGVIHQAECMHLDVSPSNILRAGERFKLADFGTVCRRGQFAVGREGAGPYVSPECLVYPDVEVGPAADVYSFGLVLMEAITGEPVPRGVSRVRGH
jgi:membrane-associated tyrosine/threonine-specific cdc2-inhibitory kinase